MGSSSFPDVVSDAVLRARRTLAEEIPDPAEATGPGVVSPMALSDAAVGPRSPRRLRQISFTP
jgi:hypothetical protein